MPILRLGRLILRTLLSLALALTIAWGALAIWIDGPAARGVAGTLAGALVLAAAALAIAVRPWRRAALAVAALFVAVLAWWLTLAPRNDRDWQRDVARLPAVTVDGQRLTIDNVRDFRYRSETDYDERWETRSYDMDQLVGVDLFVSFWGPTLYGHTIVSWEFADGSHLAVSIETRKEVGEEYSAVLGFFRQYELYYVVADERDLIALRTNHRGERVMLYRTAASRERARDLLLDYVREINELVDEPAWYNALTTNCTTAIWHHVQAIGTGAASDWRVLANGYLDELLYDLGSVNTSMPLEELRRRSDVTARGRAAGDGAGFSRAIRVGLPERPPRRGPSG